MSTSAAHLFPNENPDLREEVKTVLPNGAAWLDTQNFLFGGRKPADLIGTPEEYRVRDLLRAVKHGFVS
ncbi:MAG TPA: MbcA/ParS/Xre antitoxin family protein [Candidatus Binataceae bacterium]|nr:MbcA/ParS/Xre antitoxin family protein [Candidatus Binataceae bacterium]